MSARLTLVVAYASNRVIGRDNGLPWKLPGDLAHFKRTTLGHPIVMGRKTWESLGRPLPGRLNIVITRNAGYAAQGATVVPDIDAALRAAGARTRYSLGANAAWIAWPDDPPLARLEAAHAGLGLAGMVLTGPPDRQLLGAPRGGAFAARIRGALDPDARFPEA
jgi:hypothetical protein